MEADMKKVITAIGGCLVFGLLVLGVALAQQGGGGNSGAPSYGPGTTPMIPGTDVPAPAGDVGAAGAPAVEGGESAGGGGGGGEGGGAPAGGEAGTYIEMRKDQIVFQTACLKCHPKEKILTRHRTEAEWKDIVLSKHLMQGRINSSDAMPVLRYLNANYGPKTGPAPGTPSPAAPTAPAPPATTAAPGAPPTPGATAAPPTPPAAPAPPPPAPPAETKPAPEKP
jgi:hypothetical protein